MVDTASCTYLPSTWRTRLLATACKDCTGLKTRLPLTLIGQSSVGKLINMTIFKILSRTVSEFFARELHLRPIIIRTQTKETLFYRLEFCFQSLTVWFPRCWQGISPSVPSWWRLLRTTASNFWKRQLHVRHIIILTQTKETAFCRLAFYFQSLTLWFSRSWQGDSPSVQSWWRP